MKHWTDYWRQSASLNSFAESDAASGYSGDLAEFWQQQVKDCPKEAKIVDVGTGNGALAALIAEYGREQNKDWQISGIDAADIDPPASVTSKPELVAKLRGIAFFGNTKIENIPFADASVDAVVSQFAFEYADTQAGLIEILRVLKPGGSFVAMAHHVDSELVTDSKRGLEIYDYVLANSPLFMQVDLLFRISARALATMDWKAWSASQECIAMNKSIQWTMSVISNRYAEESDKPWLNDIFGQLVALLRGATSMQHCEQAMQHLGDVYSALQAHKVRITEQLNAALTKEKLIYLKKKAELLKSSFVVNEFRINDDLFAYTLQIKKH
ncbi:hypothetical protein CWE08_10265 [Aliidiomarina iranensis]|uniref:Methyltransferase type 11 domain-containing protein n=1 Tax=Aliidiomarina iranensis TaxID=1434071 RepID=A0A432VSK1_9GAMM|nr:class I SAM-dependent methyltransferase [Aliidiomarina iranensis]RUO19349.1 hypothetical protein CWE08_10265 [Aliidiomarina iranensis]